MSRVYPFTNENLSSYQEHINFNNRKVLSVIGSGDAYFSFLLFGSTQIDLFDINPNTINYFILKFFSLMTLTYEEFTKFFITSKLDDLKLYNKVRNYLPLKTKKHLDTIIKNNQKLTKLIFTISLNSNIVNYTTNRVIPYMDKKTYYELQKLLRNVKLPNIYTKSLQELYKELKEKYDIIALSNIYLHTNMNIKQYKNLLNHYLKIMNENGIILAHYAWNNKDEKELIENGFNNIEVPSIRLVKGYNYKDKLYLLKK